MFHSTSLLARRTILVASTSTSTCTSTSTFSKFFSSSTLALVKTLRQKTGAPIVECKKALAAQNNDLDLAIDHLRKMGVAAAAKRSGNEASEGLVAVAVANDLKRGIAVELNSETDFVARNEMFQTFLTRVANVALDVTSTSSTATTITSDITPELLESSITTEDGNTSTVSEAVEYLSGVIRENIKIRRASMITIPEGTNGMISHYVHNSIGPNQGSIGCMVAIGVDDEKLLDNINNIGRSVSLHIAAARPLYLDVESIPKDDLEREMSVHTELGLASGKPANIVEKMVTGRMRKYYEENVLVNQKSVVDEDGLPIAKVVSNSCKGASIKGFIRMEVGGEA
jgi:elongation factor Ts